MSDKTLADEIADEAELLRRRFVHATRPRGPMTMQEAAELSARMTGPLRVFGSGRVADNEQAVLVALSRKPTDDELRALHEHLRAFSAPGSPQDSGSKTGTSGEKV